MKAVTFQNFGKTDVLEISEVEIPDFSEDEVLIKVKGAGVNRPDIIQRQGFYPPPKGASSILGLEVSGTIVEIGKNIHKSFIGKKVCALLSGGGYAEYAVSNISTVLPVPDGISLLDACTIPETFFTVWTNLFDQGKQIFVGDGNCATCHTLQDANSNGNIGPNLNEIKPNFARVLSAVTNGIGVMPAYQWQLSDEEIEAVATYVVESTN